MSMQTFRHKFSLNKLVQLSLIMASHSHENVFLLWRGAVALGRVYLVFRELFSRD